MIFVETFVLLLRYSAEADNAEAMMHGQPATSMMDHMGSAQFWFESLQIGSRNFFDWVIVVLSIFLRYKGSPESKPVARRIVRQATDVATLDATLFLLSDGVCSGANGTHALLSSCRRQVFGSARDLYD